MKIKKGKNVVIKLKISELERKTLIVLLEKALQHIVITDGNLRGQINKFCRALSVDIKKPRPIDKAKE